LLHERDSLAVALAAEKRRSREFEQLWQRAEKELASVRQAKRQKLNDDVEEQPHLGALDTRPKKDEVRENWLASTVVAEEYVKNKDHRQHVGVPLRQTQEMRNESREEVKTPELCFQANAQLVELLRERYKRAKMQQPSLALPMTSSLVASSKVRAGTEEQMLCSEEPAAEPTLQADLREGATDPKHQSPALQIAGNVARC
jgi:hypothetical protein